MNIKLVLTSSTGGKRKIRLEEVEELRETGVGLIERALLAPNADIEGFSRLGFNK